MIPFVFRIVWMQPNSNEVAVMGHRNSAENNSMPRNSADNFAGVNNVDSPSLNTVEKTWPNLTYPNLT